MEGHRRKRGGEEEIKRRGKRLRLYYLREALLNEFDETLAIILSAEMI